MSRSGERPRPSSPEPAQRPAGAAPSMRVLPEGAHVSGPALSAAPSRSGGKRESAQDSPVSSLATPVQLESDTGRLVLLCVALGAERAAGLLEGLAPTVRARARACLRRVVRAPRSERHALLTMAFAAPVPRRLALQGALDLPGEFGAAVRAALDSSPAGRSTVAELSPPLRAWVGRRTRELLG
jgi:hypothetical protein